MGHVGAQVLVREASPSTGGDPKTGKGKTGKRNVKRKCQNVKRKCHEAAPLA